MAGDIFFGYDASIREGRSHNDGYVDNSTFDAFGNLLTESLLSSCTTQLDTIKEAEVMRLYSFCALSSIDYNMVIQTMRRYIAGLSNPSNWQQKGVWVWREMAEPFIRKDARYDFAFHGEEPPPPPLESP
jgi:hypothetical protein